MPKKYRKDLLEALPEQVKQIIGHYLSLQDLHTWGLTGEANCVRSQKLMTDRINTIIPPFYAALTQEEKESVSQNELAEFIRDYPTLNIYAYLTERYIPLHRGEPSEVMLNTTAIMMAFLVDRFQLNRELSIQLPRFDTEIRRLKKNSEWNTPLNEHTKMTFFAAGVLFGSIPFAPVAPGFKLFLFSYSEFSFSATTLAPAAVLSRYAAILDRYIQMLNLMAQRQIALQSIYQTLPNLSQESRAQWLDYTPSTEGERQYRELLNKIVNELTTDTKGPLLNLPVTQKILIRAWLSLLILLNAVAFMHSVFYFSPGIIPVASTFAADKFNVFFTEENPTSSFEKTALIWLLECVYVLSMFTLLGITSYAEEMEYWLPDENKALSESITVSVAALTSVIPMLLVYGLAIGIKTQAPKIKRGVQAVGNCFTAYYTHATRANQEREFNDMEAGHRVNAITADIN